MDRREAIAVWSGLIAKDLAQERGVDAIAERGLDAAHHLVGIRVPLLQPVGSIVITAATPLFRFLNQQRDQVAP